MRLIAAALVAAFGLTAAAQDKTTIEWKLKKGDKVRYEMNQETQTSVGGMEIEQSMLFGMAMEVEEVDDKGVAKFKVTYDRIKVVMSGMMDTDYDSDKDDAAPEGFAKMFGGMVGKSFKIKLNARGEIVGVEGYKALMEEAMKDLGDDPMMGAMQDQFDDDMIKKMMQPVFPVLPDKAVAKGDTWEHKSEFGMPGLGSMKLKSKKTLKETGDKEATIGDETTMEAGDEGDGNQMVQITDGKSKGDIVWDLEKGQMKSSKATMTMTMSAGGQEFTMEMKSSMKLAPREAKPKKDEKKKDVPSVDKDKKDENKDK